MTKKLLISSVALLIIVGGIFYWKGIINKGAEKTTSDSKNVKALPKEVTITLDKNGYSPNTVTVKVGSAVRWKNVSGENQTVNSDNYPNNQLHRELNFGVFTSGSSVVYIFKKPGTYGFHNQLHPEQKGKVIVTK